MSTKIYPVDCLPERILLGRQSESSARQVHIDCQPWLAQWPDLSIDIWVTPPVGDAYPANTRWCDDEGHILEWTISSTDTAYAGDGTMEVVGLLDGIKALSAVTQTYVTASTTAVPGTTPEAYQGWVDQVLAAGAEANEAAELAAASEQIATEAADRAELAAASVEALVESATKAEEEADASAETAANAAMSATASAAQAAESASVADTHRLSAADEAGNAERAATAAEASATAAATSEANAASAVVAAQEAAQEAADMLELARRTAPAIECEVSGEVATCTDAAARDALAVVSHITAVQEGEGDPSPDNVRPITGWSAVNLWHGAAYDASAEPVLTAGLPEEVYGGTLDLVSGVLTVTHKMATLTSASGYWAVGSNNFWINVNDRSENSTLLSNRFVTTSRVATQMRGGEMRLSPTYPRVVFANPGNALTQDEWKAQLDASPIQLLYELAEPYTIQLTPQQLTMLKGSNAAWSDTGDTAVAYIADTKMYIDNAIAAIAASIINA